LQESHIVTVILSYSKKIMKLLRLRKQERKKGLFFPQAEEGPYDQYTQNCAAEIQPHVGEHACPTLGIDLDGLVAQTHQQREKGGACHQEFTGVVGISGQEKAENGKLDQMCELTQQGFRHTGPKDLNKGQEAVAFCTAGRGRQSRLEKDHTDPDDAENDPYGCFFQYNHLQKNRFIICAASDLRNKSQFGYKTVLWLLYHR